MGPGDFFCPIPPEPLSRKREGFVQDPECNGIAERSIRTLEDDLRFDTLPTVAGPVEALWKFKRAGNGHRLIERHGLRAPNQDRREVAAESTGLVLTPFMP